MLIGTHPGGIGVVATWNLTYLPEILSFNHAGNQLTSLRVETQEDGVLFDLAGAGITAINGYCKVGTQTANDVSVRLADGELRPKNVTITAVTSAVGAINFYVNSDNKGVVAFKTTNAAILALNPTVFQKFMALFIPTMATLTDYAMVYYADGQIQRMEIEDLRRRSSEYQQVEGIIINNVNQTIKKVEIVCAAATPAYVLAVDL